MRIDKFHQIKELYDKFYQTFYAKGKKTVADTEKGIWGHPELRIFMIFLLK